MEGLCLTFMSVYKNTRNQIIYLKKKYFTSAMFLKKRNPYESVVSEAWYFFSLNSLRFVAY